VKVAGASPTSARRGKRGGRGALEEATRATCEAATPPAMGGASVPYFQTTTRICRRAQERVPKQTWRPPTSPTSPKWTTPSSRSSLVSFPTTSTTQAFQRPRPHPYYLILRFTSDGSRSRCLTHSRRRRCRRVRAAGAPEASRGRRNCKSKKEGGNEPAFPATLGAAGSCALKRIWSLTFRWRRILSLSMKNNSAALQKSRVAVLHFAA
jgi:hypothetical protein